MEQDREGDIMRVWRQTGSMTAAVQSAGFPSIADVPTVDMARIWALVQEEQS